MYRILFYLTLLLPFVAVSQPKYSAETTRLLKTIGKSSLLDAALMKENGFQVTARNGKSYVSFLALVNHQFNKSDLSLNDIEMGSRTGNIVSLHVPLTSLEWIARYEGLDYLSLALKVHPELNRVLPDVRADSVHAGIGLPQPYTGKDVIIGITDWGFDYTHPGFYDTIINETRILKAWDQFRNQGPAPAGFSYGTEIAGHAALQAAQCDTFNIYEWATHGSHVAGIAGGNGAGTLYRGVAYEANYLMATFLVNEAAVFDAFNWMKQSAEALQKRLVVNMSWGLYYMGNLDGTSLLGQAMDIMSDEGVVFVSSGGNNGSVNFHIRHDFATETDTMKTVVNFDTYAYYPHMWGQAVSIWGTPACPFAAGIKILNTGNQVVLESPMYASAGMQGYVEDTLIVGNDTIPYNLTVEDANYLNQRPHIHLRVQCKTLALKVGLYVIADTGVVHAWNIIELDNGVGNWGVAFGAPAAGFKGGDKNYGVGEPACNHSVVAVAAYASEYYTVSGSLTGGTIATFSSFGPVMDGRMKPDISAPGVSVISSLSSFTNYVPQSGSVVETIEWGGRSYKYSRMSGTSMSGPAVAGVVALMLEAGPSLSSAEIRQILIETAREDWRTGDIPDSGSTRWGWGKVHAWRAIDRILGNRITTNTDNGIYVFPNPASEFLTLAAENTEPVEVCMYSLTGVPVLQTKVSGQERISLEGIPAGIYLLQAEQKGLRGYYRVVVL